MIVDSKMPLFKGLSLRPERSESPVPGSSDSESSKKFVCVTCPRRLHKNDAHLKCYECLGPYHKINECGPCSQLSSSARYKRRKAINYYFKNKEWPKSLESVDSDGSFQTAKQSQSKEDDNNVEVQAEVHQENLPASQGADSNVQTAQEVEIVEQNNNQMVHDLASDLPVQEVEDDQDDHEVVEVDQETELPSQSLGPDVSEEIRRQFDLFCKQKQLQKPPLKRPGIHEQVTPAPKNPRVDIAKDPVITSLQSQVSDVAQNVQLLLAKLSGPEQQQQTGHDTNTNNPDQIKIKIKIKIPFQYLKVGQDLKFLESRVKLSGPPVLSGYKILKRVIMIM